MSIAMMAVFILTFFVNFILTVSGEEMTYCVKSAQNSTCPDLSCQQCETLEYYFENINETINQHNNVTMIFMNGYHQICQSSMIITASNVMMVGESKDITVQGQHSTIHFKNNVHVNIEDLVLKEINIKVDIKSSLAKQLIFQFVSVKLYCSEVTARIPVNMSACFEYIGCTLQNGKLSIISANNTVRSTNVTIINSKMLNNSISVAKCVIRISGLSEFKNAWTSAISLYNSAIILSGMVLFENNTATRGGAMALYASWLYFEAGISVEFTYNTAKDKGGAIFTKPDFQPYLFNHQYMFNYCFYNMLNCDNTASRYSIYFGNNSAVNGGNDIYGGPPEKFCDIPCSYLIEHESNEDFSSLSSDPTRICLCDDSGVPQCLTLPYIYTNCTVYPGETLSLSVVVVGGDFGPTTGTVHAGFLNSKHSFLRPTSQYGQAIDNKHCNNLNYTIYSDQTNNTEILYLSQEYMDSQEVRSYIHLYYFTPILLYITILPCPSGLTLRKYPPKCDCYKVLTDNFVTCKIKNGTGYFIWSGNMWINITNNGVIYTMYCPLDYCTVIGKSIDMQSDPDSQCAFNRAGRLCGGCKDGYSVAIGSSHCIHCPDNNNLALIIFFAVAGLLLVLFIYALNLTVSQGMINGLIFYANIVWTFRTIFFPQEQSTNGLLLFLRTFIAWVNLDFVIKVCFVNGLTAFWKTWLQFIFPLYIWTIAGAIIVASRYSIRLTNLLGNRAVPVLDTLFLLSYMKLLRTLSAAMDFLTLIEYPSETKLIVWSEDGNLTYFGFPHVLLFLAGLATLMFLWLPYTLLLLLMQCLRRVSHLRFLRWIMRFHPVYDAYFAPLKTKHQYWFGVLLLARGILLISFASTFGISQSINLLFLSIVGIVLLFYMTLTQPYKSRALLLLHGSFLTNLTLLSGCAIYASQTHAHGSRLTLKTVIVGLSTGFAFLKFCGIILYLILAPWCPFKRDTSNIEKPTEEEKAEPKVANYGFYRDPIFDTVPLQ